MHLRKVKGVEDKILEYSDVVCFNPTENKGKWHEVFGNDNPIYLEVGMGKGKFIRTNAINNPDINYIGCEICTSIVYKAAKESKDIPNLVLINFDALKLSEVFDKDEIDKLFLNFSDPWPKSRHEKRRLTSSAFLEVYKDLLKDPGLVEFKTDNRNLFEYSIMVFNHMHYEILDLSLDYHNSGYENIITTEYEDKFMSKGQVIYFVKLRLK